MGTSCCQETGQQQSKRKKAQSAKKPTTSNVPPGAAKLSKKERRKQREIASKTKLLQDKLQKKVLRTAKRAQKKVLAEIRRLGEIAGKTDSCPSSDATVSPDTAGGDLATTGNVRSMPSPVLPSPASSFSRSQYQTLRVRARALIKLSVPSAGQSSQASECVRAR